MNENKLVNYLFMKATKNNNTNVNIKIKKNPLR